jgi:late competence protein required for DNA uptake (superfamily II DNA/RNA helicase)
MGSKEIYLEIPVENVAESDEWKNKVRELAKQNKLIGIDVSFEKKSIFVTVTNAYELERYIKQQEDTIVKDYIEETLPDRYYMLITPHDFYIEASDKNIDKAIEIINAFVASRTSGIFFLPYFLKDTKTFEIMVLG